MKCLTRITVEQGKEIAEILNRRANEIASYKNERGEKELPGSVELALSREIHRLREIAKACTLDEEEAELNQHK